MKMTLNLSNTYLIVDEEHQAAMLSLLESSKMYTREGWSTDSQYNPSSDLPGITFIKESQLNGYEENIKQMQDKLNSKNSEYYQAVNAKGVVEKQLKELQEKFEALEGIVRGVANAE